MQFGFSDFGSFFRKFRDVGGRLLTVSARSVKALFLKNARRCSTSQRALAGKKPRRSVCFVWSESRDFTRRRRYPEKKTASKMRDWYPSDESLDDLKIIGEYNQIGIGPNCER